MEQHTIPPLYDQESTVLILGSFPSVKSREACFYYHHKQNRFYKVLAAIFQEPLPTTIEEKKAFLLRHNIALWDVIASCDIKGSSDASITNVEVNDLDLIIQNANIQHIYTNGNLADKYFKKYFDYAIPYTKLPSTSPANAAYSLEKLIENWKVILE